MPYKLELTLGCGRVILSPCIVPNNCRSKFWLDDKKIPREINKTGRSMVKRLADVKSFRCVRVS